MSISQRSLGTVDGESISLYTLSGPDGTQARITNFGATLVGLDVADALNQMTDVTLGFDALDGYLVPGPYMGAIVGRCANRIRAGRFRIDAHEYCLALNDGSNHLHGGTRGFDKVVWVAEDRTELGEIPALAMRYVSPDGEEGYPGTLTVEVVFTLTAPAELRIDMSAHTDRATVVNLAHHSYWNLSGRPGGTILDHELSINAKYYTPVDDGRIPTGRVEPVAGTPYDFRVPKPIGRDIGNVPGGYDVNYVLDGEPGVLRLAARVHEPVSGRAMELHTTQPGLQFYDGSKLDGHCRGKGQTLYCAHTGFCLESQHFPDSPNHPEFPSAVLRPGQVYRHSMVHRFYSAIGL